MRRFLLSVAVSLLMGISVQAATIINVPIDGRPVSNEYLQKLTEIGGDEYLSVSRENMDIFSAYDELNRFGNSKAIRQELKTLVEAHNTKDTTVIIATSGYITNGLVGARCAVNYGDYKEAFSELKELIKANPEPTYRINICIPRTLPETRLVRIWKTDEKSLGLAHFFIKATGVTDTELKEKYEYVTPVQLIVEYSYVKNKSTELGVNKLETWEKDFLDYFEKEYSSPEYRAYIDAYELPFKATADMFNMLLEMKSEGYNIDIVVGCDDHKLPDSIAYLDGKSLFDTPKENGVPVKFSFARSYMCVYPNSIEKTIESHFGIQERNLSKRGMGKDINIIHGADEIPQLMYARDYTQRHSCSARFDIRFNDIVNKVAAFDVKRPADILRGDIAFTRGAATGYTNKPFSFFVYDYNSKKASSIGLTLKEMVNANKNGNNVGLVELYSTPTSSNLLYKKLLASSEAAHTTRLATGVWQLDTYSAWNTNANAIGLGVAQAQVYAVAEDKGLLGKNEILAQAQLLATHILEDGEYTKHGKLELVNRSFKPADLENSEDLYNVLNTDEVMDALKGAEFKTGDETYKIEDIGLKVYTFPWMRTFECYLENDVKLG